MKCLYFLNSKSLKTDRYLTFFKRMVSSTGCLFLLFFKLTFRFLNFFAFLFFLLNQFLELIISQVIIIIDSLSLPIAPSVFLDLLFCFGLN
jgi:hypothetical protein